MPGKATPALDVPCMAWLALLALSGDRQPAELPCATPPHQRSRGASPAAAAHLPSSPFPCSGGMLFDRIVKLQRLKEVGC